MSILHQKFLHGGDYNPDQWLDRPDILEEDLRQMKRAGVNVVSLGIFSWAVLEPEEGKYDFSFLEERIEALYNNDIYTILATPSGARPMWMAYRYPEVLRVRADGVKEQMGGRHNHCYTSPVYRKKIWELDRRLAEKFAGHPGVIAWHISNEFGGACWCEKCQEAFREFLKEKYGSLEALNREWWTSFWSHRYDCWEHVQAPAPHGENATHGLNLDWKRFCSRQTADFCAWEKKALEAGGSVLPVTSNLMGFYDGLNYTDFRDVLDLVSWDNYPEWHSGEKSDAALAVETACAADYMRCIHGDRAPFLLMESTPSVTNWQRISRLKRPGMHMLSSLQALAHGADSVQYFQWRKGRGGSEKFHGAVLDHDATTDTRVFRDVAQVGRRLEGLEEICGSMVRPKAVILFDQENRWALEDSFGPRVSGIHYMETIQAHYGALWRLGIPADVIDSGSSLEEYRLVIAPMLYLLKGDIAERLSHFVEQGGTLIGTYQTGLVNENDLCFEGRVPHDMTAVFGLHREEIDSLWDGQSNHTCWNGKEYKLTELCERVYLSTASALAVYQEDFYAGEPVLTVNSYGRGRAYYMAARAGMDFLQDFYGKTAPQAGVLPCLKGVFPEGVTVTMRTKGDREYLFVQNWNPGDAVVIPEEELTDFETGEPVEGQMWLAGYEVRILVRGNCG
ncbi:MAG: beta-galactosidase [Lachnospiraceae bacterium]|nr:beta-galactosidase [Lachnospiraceae bacterium]